MQQYTVITLCDYDIFISTQSATTPEQALINHAVYQGHIAETPAITLSNIGTTLIDNDVEYIVREGHYIYKPRKVQHVNSNYQS
jgi:hypothetical protein